MLQLVFLDYLASNCYWSNFDIMNYYIIRNSKIIYSCDIDVVENEKKRKNRSSSKVSLHHLIKWT